MSDEIASVEKTIVFATEHEWMENVSTTNWDPEEGYGSAFSRAVNGLWFMHDARTYTHLT